MNKETLIVISYLAMTAGNEETFESIDYNVVFCFLEYGKMNCIELLWFWCANNTGATWKQSYSW